MDRADADRTDADRADAVQADTDRTDAGHAVVVGGQRLAGAIRDAGLDVSIVDDTTNVADAMQDADVLVVGPELDAPVRMVQRTHRSTGDLPTVIVVLPESAASVTSDLNMAAFVGDDVTCVTLPGDTSEDVGRVTQAVAQAASRARARRRYVLQTGDDDLTPRGFVDRLGAPSLERLVDALLHHPEMGIIVLGEANIVGLATQTAARLLGGASRSIEGAPLGQLLVDLDGTALQIEEGVRTTARLRGPRETYLELSSWPIADPTPASQTIATIRDVTEVVRARQVREETQRILEASETRFRAGFHSASVGMAVTEPTGRVLEANGALAALLGTQTLHLVGTLFGRWCDADQADRFGSALAIVGDGTAAGSTGEWLLRREDGADLWCHVSMAGFDDLGGRRIILQVLDISGRKMAERALVDAYEREHRAADQLRRVDEIKTEFMAGISHDLKTPLSIMMGVAETLDVHWDRLTADRARTLMDQLTKHGRRLDGMLSDLLELARVQRGALRPVVSTVSVRSSIVKLLRTAELEGHPVSVEVDTALERVNLDRVWLERILENLLRNAVRHTPQGTPIALRCWAEADVMHLTVVDHGPGVPETEREEIFEPFRQGPTRHPDGTGVGLALVRRFAELHGGGAWLEDTPGGGATFHVTITPVKPV